VTQNLFWRPYKPKDGTCLSHGIKKAFEGKLGHGFGAAILAETNTNVVGFLQGLMLANEDSDVGKDAKELLAALEKHDEIEVYVE